MNETVKESESIFHQSYRGVGM